jgi:hypothetical protein
MYTDAFVEFYVAKIKEHEAARMSTNDRNMFWREYWENKK